MFVGRIGEIIEAGDYRPSDPNDNQRTEKLTVPTTGLMSTKTPVPIRVFKAQTKIPPIIPEVVHWHCNAFYS